LNDDWHRYLEKQLLNGLAFSFNAHWKLQRRKINRYSKVTVSFRRALWVTGDKAHQRADPPHPTARAPRAATPPPHRQAWL
jgi:hypothetical protein